MPRKLDCGAVAGYSGTPLAQKLGLKPGLAAALLHPPRGFFTRSRRQLAAQLPALQRALAPTGALWISWPKQASGVATDLTEDVIRALALPRGL
ncbi:MAG: DUF3052 domain-containing protein, partial [Bacillati bacterium ANGP1]